MRFLVDSDRTSSVIPLHRPLAVPPLCITVPCLKCRCRVVTHSVKGLPTPLSESERASLQGVSLEAMCAVYKAPFAKGSSAYRGVSKRGKRWLAKFSADNVSKYLGTFKLEVDAAKAYDQAAIDRHGRCE